MKNSLKTNKVASKSSKSEQLLGNQRWRLNNLYYIVDKDSKKVLFVMNEPQQKFFKELHYWNIILKARQLGFSTLIDIMALDTALFNNNMAIMIIADNLEDAEGLFKTKIKFPYDNLPDWLRDERKAKLDSARHLQFSNNSSISVSTSARTSTINFLHVSELSKICVEHPDRAKEIKTGSFPAVHAGNMLFIESTARGASGDFYDICKEAEDRKLKGIEPNKRQFKFHFFPWYESDSNKLDSKGMAVYPWLDEYFRDLKLKHNISLSPEQKAWYATESANLGSDIRSENPSFPEEAFHVPLEGAYYSIQFRKMREDVPCRITKVPYMPAYNVDTYWDIGVDDSTAIWFVQVVGREAHFIDYYENTGEGVQHYANILKEKLDESGWTYGRHIGPWDLENRVWAIGADTVLNTARRLGIRFEVAPKLPSIDGIESVRQMLGVAWFDEKKCNDGITKLEKYRKAWDNKKGMWRNTPLHDDSSHAADAIRTGAVCWKKEFGKRRLVIPVKQVSAEAWT